MRKLCIVLLLMWGSLNAVMRDIVESIHVIRFDSVRQQVVDGNTVILEGDVEVFVGPEMMRVMADKVVLDKTKKTIDAYSDTPGGVKLETETFVMLADHVFLSVDKRTGSAENLRLSMDGMYMFAKEAVKIDEEQWLFKDIAYSACDKLTAHWKIHAKSARLDKYFFKARGLYFKLGGVPVFFLPGLYFPGQSHKKSGFLTPRLYFGGPLGFGFKQEFFWHLRNKLDTTIGLKWREKKGFVVFDEFRWARAQDMYTVINSQVAREYNAFKERDSEIKKVSDMRYWIYGDNYHTFTIPNTEFEANTLARIDFGTDKRINYDFFSLTDSIDDQFQNDVIVRYPRPNDNISLSFNRTKIVRDRFSFPAGGKTELEERIRIMNLPHVEWNSAFREIASRFTYKHTFFTDQAFLDRHVVQKEFIDRRVVSARDLTDITQDTARFWYRGFLRNTLPFKHNTITTEIQPYFILNNRIDNYNAIGKLRNAYEGAFSGEGAFKTFLGAHAEWALPEWTRITQDGTKSFYLQPALEWNYTPHFRQNHWFAIDSWDRIFARNYIDASLKSSLYWNSFEFQGQIRQGYEFYNKSDIFPLRRTPLQHHLTPLELQLAAYSKYCGVDLSHEFDLNGITHLASQIGLRGFYKNFDIGVNLSYQKPAVLRERELLSDVPSFANFYCGLPINRGLKLNYSGHLYSQANSIIGAFESFNPISHMVNIDYKGHCWGFIFGFEERRYRQQGRIKSEQAFMFSFKLDTLGSFAKHFKREAAIMKAPQNY
jgi:hypothetical protein